MNSLTCLPVAALVAVAFLATAAAASETTRSKPQVQGLKLDSGLGDLPHYRIWADKSGRNVTAQLVVGEKVDSGLGDIVPYSLGKDGLPRGVDVAQRR